MKTVSTIILFLLINTTVPVFSNDTVSIYGLLAKESTPTKDITIAPQFKKRVKAKVNMKIRKKEIEGVVKVKVLVDTDGAVKKLIALNDLGYGTKEAAINAAKKTTFYPAKRGDEKVAVWIVIPYRFQKK